MARKRWSFWMTPLEHGFIRGLDDRYRTLLTPAGRAVFWAATASSMMLLGGLVLPLVAVFAACVSALLCAVLLGLFFRPRVELARILPPPASAGDTYTYRITLENKGKRAARHVVVEERGLPAELRPIGEAPMVPVLRPGERCEVEVRLACLSRGAYELPGLQAASTFPSGLVKVPRRHPRAQRLLVYPRFTPLASFEVPHGRHYQPGGIAIASQVGESTEFLGTRDWRHGDRVRDVHWPSFARTGRLIVKEFQEEYFVRLALVVDIEARDAKGEARLEQGLSLAAGIADALARREYVIDLFAAGPEIHRFQAGRALAHFDHILELLACVEAGDSLNVAALEQLLLPEAARLSAVILVLLDWDDARAALVARLKSHGLAVRVACLHPKRRPELPPDELWGAS